MYIKFMTKIKTVKLEFTSTPPNNQKSFDINTKKYGNKINCTAKAAGKKNINYFSSKFKFTVDASSKNLKINNIHIVDVTHIGKTNNPIKKCGKYHYYYNINCPDSSSSSSDIIDDAFEQTIYNAIKCMLMTAKVTKVGNHVKVTLTLPTLFIDSMCMNVRIGTTKFSKSSGCNDSCSLSPINKCSKSSSSSSSSCKDYNHNKILKLIAWSAIVAFVIYVIKKKCCINKIFGNKTDVIEIDAGEVEEIEYKDNDDAFPKEDCGCDE